jgi:hypothetical protein
MLEAETNLDRWRVNWAGAVALTRAVGHVLDKVDGAANPIMKEAAKAAFKRWNGSDPEHEIFREFVENSRNSILKEYRVSHHPLEEVDVAVNFTLRHPETGEIRQQVEVVPIGDNIYRPILEGYREGDDARDILSDALDWWTTELDGIDAFLATKRKNDA